MEKATVSQRKHKLGKGFVTEFVIRNGRRIVGSIWEPSSVTDYRYKVHVRIAPGYGLHQATDTLPEAVLAFDDLTDYRYSFNF